MYENTKVKGDQGELEALCFFRRHGYCVSIPFGENAPYDLLVEAPSRKLYRVQVRASSWKNEALTLRLRVVSKNYSRAIDFSRVDIFAVWDGESIYVVPTSEVQDCINAISLRRGTPRNGQTKKIRFADSFREALHLCP